MKGHLASLAALALLWLALVPISAAALRLLWPRLLRASAGRDPVIRARRAFLAAVAPLAIPSVIVALCALPGVVGALTGAGDHCLAHGEHPHFCPVHATLAMTPLLAVALAAFAVLLLALAVRTTATRRALIRERRWLVGRRAGALAPDVARLDDPLPLALTHGLRRPAVWISNTLLERLDEDERAVVFAHERAHAARRDPARFAAATIASALHLPAARRAILSELRTATEQACDARAARAVGDDRLRVATTLLHVERLMRRASPGERPIALATALIDSSLPARIEALLESPSAVNTGPPPLRAGWLCAAAALLLASPVHHLAEHALEFVLRSMVGIRLLS